MDVNLVLYKKNGASKSFHLPSSVTVIGRKQECDLCIPLMVVSRRHCEINQDQDNLKIRDMGSRNGTYVNGQRVEEAEVSPGDKIQIGPLTFAVQINGMPAELVTDESAILQAPDHLVSSQRQIVERPQEFTDEKNLDMNKTFSSSEMLNGISEDNN
jgi:pSer/pThr/pTyr-binding forkhead associated (FHA) protein